MATTEKQKQSLYFPDEMLREIMRESIRLDRSLSWMVQQAWRLARSEMRKLPAVERDGLESPGAVHPGRPSAQVQEFLKGRFDHDVTT